MSLVLAIDPGPERSAFVVWDGERVTDHCILPNEEMVRMLRYDCGPLRTGLLVIEQIRGYGMIVGQETFDTCFWTGRFAEAWCGGRFRLLPRREVKLYLCGSARAKDANVRRAVLDAVGPQGTKANPGPTYGIRADEWAALALALAAVGAEDRHAGG